MAYSDFPETSASLLSTLRKRPGDSEAWAKFVQTYGPRILRWCRRWGLQDADAHDVTQDVLVQLARGFGSFKYDNNRRFRGWLKKVVHASRYKFLKSHRAWNQGAGGDSPVDPIESIAVWDHLSDAIDGDHARESLAASDGTGPGSGRAADVAGVLVS